MHDDQDAAAPLLTFLDRPAHAWYLAGMRTAVPGEHRFATLLLAAGLLAGCGTHAARSPAARHAPPPADPDLGTVVERFYGDVEGRHWAIAYAMLSPRLHATLSQPAFQARYATLTDADVALRQTGARTVVAKLVAHDRPHERRLEERWTLIWDGEAWMLDGLSRRDL